MKEVAFHVSRVVRYVKHYAETEGPMTTLSEEVLSEMVQAIVQVADPDRIILLGSRGRGSFDDVSDVDLLVIEREAFEPSRSRRQELLKIRHALAGFRVAKDILVYSQEEVAKWKDCPGHIVEEALSTGRLLYACS